MTGDGADALPVEEQTLLDRGRDRVHRLRLPIREVDLGRLVEDGVVIEPEGSRRLDRQRDAHGGDRDHHLDLEVRQHRSQLGPRRGAEGHPVIDGDHEGDGQRVAERHDGQIDLL